MPDSTKAPSSWSRFGKLFLAVMGHPRLSPAEKVVHDCQEEMRPEATWLRDFGAVEELR